MGVQRTILKFFQLRACLVLAALISLCVSSNVGPRFLPLPAIDGAAVSQSEPESPSVLRQSYCEADRFRVPMMSQTQKRTEKQFQQPAVAAVPSKDVLIYLNDSRAAVERHYANSHLKQPTVSLFLGRAPPEHV